MPGNKKKIVISKKPWLIHYLAFYFLGLLVHNPFLEVNILWTNVSWVPRRRQKTLRTSDGELTKRPSDTKSPSVGILGLFGTGFYLCCQESIFIGVVKWDIKRKTTTPKKKTTKKKTKEKMKESWVQETNSLRDRACEPLDNEIECGTAVVQVS